MIRRLHRFFEFVSSAGLSMLQAEADPEEQLNALLSDVTRVVVVDYRDRPGKEPWNNLVYEQWGVTVEAGLQDEGHTLKLWVPSAPGSRSGDS